MKICLINNLYKPQGIGGAEKAVENIAKALVDLGHEVVVVAVGVGTFQQVNDNGYKIIYLENKFAYHRLDGVKQTFFKKLLWHSQNIFSSAQAQQINKLFSDWQPQIVWTHNLSGLGWQVVNLIKKYKIIHWHELHDFQLIDPQGSYFRSNQIIFFLLQPFYFIYGLLAKIIFNKVDLVVGPSKFIVNFFVSRGFFKTARIQVQANPLGDNFYQRVSLINVSQPLKCLYIGQVEKHKGLDLLIEVFNDLQAYDIVLTVVGDGNYLPMAQVKNKNNKVRFLGYKDSNQVKTEILASHLVLLPSICIENSPTVIAEAICLGRPVLASNVGGVPEMVTDNLNGWLLRAGDFRAWLDKLKNISDQPEQLLKLQSGLEVTAKKYSDQEYKNWLTKNLTTTF